MSARKLGLLVLWLACTVAKGASAEEPPYHVAADPSAPAVTRASVGASERFWPYQIELVEPWQPAGQAEPLPAGTLAVLVRIEDSGLARVDFGRDGLFEVPVEKTDLLARANAVRLGAEQKLAPNLVHSIGPRLVDPKPEKVTAFPFAAAFEPPGFVCVFADPRADGFAAIASALSPLGGRHGVMTVLVPQGARPGLETREMLRALDWRVPFVMDSYAEGYTRSLLPEGTSRPAVMALTPEGRVIFQSTWTADAARELAAALDEAFGARPARTAAVKHAPAQ
jgi:hypothetical protein